jgi:hypothetical protein
MDLLELNGHLNLDYRVNKTARGKDPTVGIIHLDSKTEALALAYNLEPNLYFCWSEKVTMVMQWDL